MVGWAEGRRKREREFERLRLAFREVWTGRRVGHWVGGERFGLNWVGWKVLENGSLGLGYGGRGSGWRVGSRVGLCAEGKTRQSGGKKHRRDGVGRTTNQHRITTTQNSRFHIAHIFPQLKTSYDAKPSTRSLPFFFHLSSSALLFSPLASSGCVYCGSLLPSSSRRLGGLLSVSVSVSVSVRTLHYPLFQRCLRSSSLRPASFFFFFFLFRASSILSQAFVQATCRLTYPLSSILLPSLLPYHLYFVFLTSCTHGTPPPLPLTSLQRERETNVGESRTKTHQTHARTPT
ncbi:hypothetical protein B0H34DRAFT_709399 [Crassisporium funariophilum]|nr:hypothetical protein B0H34DRAFT_709399 [Crassisporium funariophilum]